MLKQLTPEELQLIKDLQIRYNQSIIELGSIEFQILTYEKYISALKIEKSNLISDLNSIEQKEKEITDKLVEKYGSGNINPETGEITIN